MAIMKRYFVFRVDYEEAHPWLMDELFGKGLLRQGWGKENFYLRDENGKQVNKNDWSKEYREVWDDDTADILKRYNILTRMLEIKEGDLLVIPKTGELKMFTIC